MFIVDIVKKVTRLDGSSPRKCRSQTVSLTQSSRSFYLIQKISESHFPVYQVLTKGSREHRVMKLFSYQDEEAQKHYKNEARFAALNHNNIIRIISYGDKREISHNDQPSTFSYILMEYAPHGDFFDLTKNYGAYFDEKIIRTYFRQLIEGLEYLHENRVAHLDLKPENLLMGSDFRLKIADFDGSYVQGDEQFLNKGNNVYSGPEILDLDAKDSQITLPFAADIYSVGIILFLMKSRVFPYFQHQIVEGVDLLDLMSNHNEDFWRIHCEIQDKTASFYDQSFRELFNGMVKANPSQRLTIKQIKKSKWYNGPVYSNSKLQKMMSEILNSRQMA